MDVSTQGKMATSIAVVVTVSCPCIFIGKKLRRDGMDVSTQGKMATSSSSGSSNLTNPLQKPPRMTELTYPSGTYILHPPIKAHTYFKVRGNSCEILYFFKSCDL
jgi:hypothetical protein